MAVGNQPARLAAIHNVDGRHGLFFDNDLAGVAVGGSLARRRECELSSEPAIRRHPPISSIAESYHQYHQPDITKLKYHGSAQWHPNKHLVLWPLVFLGKD